MVLAKEFSRCPLKNIFELREKEMALATEMGREREREREGRGRVEGKFFVLPIKLAQFTSQILKRPPPPPQKMKSNPEPHFEK